jgi:choline dehydrogenase
MSQWDYIIIGAGSAGCAAAYELGHSGQNKVLLIESGGNNGSPCIRIPALVVKATRKFNWGYLSQPDPSRDGKADSWIRGRVLGGSSSINGMMFVRGAPHDFARWAAAGNRGWSYEDILPLYREMETSDQVNSLRGHRGALHVRTVTRPHPLSAAFVMATTKLCGPFNPDYNGESQEGVSYAQLSQRCGLRCSSADAFIKPLLRKRNVRLLLGANVDCINFNGTVATGVTFDRGGESSVVAARRIVLCAGAINSPKLLMLSGIGDAVELTRLGIKPVLNSLEVGKNLQEHPTIRLIYKTRVESNNLSGGVIQKLGIIRAFALHRQGPISTVFEATAFLRTSAGLEHPDIQLHFLAMGVMNVGDNTSPFLGYPSVSIYVTKNYPKSRGAIRLASANPADAPLIECRLLNDPEDVETLVLGARVVREITNTSPMRELIDEEVIPGRAHLAPEALRRYVPPHTEISYHPVGTCRMGPDPSAVVTPDLRVNGVENLWVADGSVMPDLISGNTNAACMMIGMKLGRDLSRSR